MLRIVNKNIYLNLQGYYLLFQWFYSSFFHNAILRFNFVMKMENHFSPMVLTHPLIYFNEPSLQVCKIS